MNSALQPARNGILCGIMSSQKRSATLARMRLAMRLTMARSRSLFSPRAALRQWKVLARNLSRSARQHPRLHEVVDLVHISSVRRVALVELLEEGDDVRDAVREHAGAYDHGCDREEPPSVRLHRDCSQCTTIGLVLVWFKSREVDVLSP